MRKRSECNCECHTNKHVRHFVACCHEDDEDLSFSVKVNENIPTPQQLIGQTEIHVNELINNAGMDFRVMKRDGESFLGTADFNPERFNLEIENGIITNVYLG
jgi:hypothetical protein